MSGENSDTAAHLLRNRSLAASRPCRHLTRQLALGDVAAAHINGPSALIPLDKEQFTTEHRVFVESYCFVADRSHQCSYSDYLLYSRSNEDSVAMLGVMIRL
jgi:hypothetical protein